MISYMISCMISYMISCMISCHRLQILCVSCNMISCMISHMISHMISCCVQDCVVLLAPYPNNPNQVESFNIKTDFDLKGDGLVWYARPQLFFNCTLCPTGAKESMYSASHKEVSLVYFSTFEPITLTPDSIMQQAGVPMLYDSASNPRLPCLQICSLQCEKS